MIGKLMDFLEDGLTPKRAQVILAVLILTVAGVLGYYVPIALVAIVGVVLLSCVAITLFILIEIALDR